jgi:uncharacterized radical SAM superfamily Fe-S cluster-containing enzyme
MKEMEQFHILIFKTNIRFKKDIKLVQPLLEKHSSILKWNIDRHDSDKVLRLEAVKNIAKEIIKQLRQAGYYCEELAG